MRPLEDWRRCADEETVIARLRTEKGFGLIELIVSLIMLNIGVLAIIAAFNSGTFALQRASQTSTASVLADKQMELYRALLWTNIALDSTSKATACADATYAADLSPCATQVTKTCAGSPAECVAMQTVTGPDKLSYRVDTYIVTQVVANRRDVKLVTVIVRRTGNAKAFARISSTFEQSTG